MWLDNNRNHLSERESSGEEAQDRVQWRRLMRNIDTHVNVGKDAEEELSACLSPIFSKTVYFVIQA